MAIVGKLWGFESYQLLFMQKTVSESALSQIVRCSKYFLFYSFPPKHQKYLLSAKCVGIYVLFYFQSQNERFRDLIRTLQVFRVLLITCHICFKVTLWWMLCGIVFKNKLFERKNLQFFLPKAVFFESCLIQNQVKSADTQFLFMLIWNP